MTDLIDVEQRYETAIDNDGSLNLRPEVLQRIGLNAGDPVRIVIVDGEIKLRPVRLIVSQMAAEINQIMAEEGVTLDDLLSGLDEVGEEVFREIYGNASTD
jgi:hypothetical protein